MASVDHVPDLSRLFSDEDAKWRATLERDVRADGLFYYAVRTTGIFCRPTCPARKPKRANVAFHADGADAEAAGFRACKVCRPNFVGRPMTSGSCSVRPAAILFADVVGSSRMAKSLRPDEVMVRLGEFHDWTGRLVRAHDGVIHKNLGDGFMAVFGDDSSRPGDALQAVRCGVALMDAATLLATSGRSLIDVGIGVHYGLVAFGDAGGSRALLGDTVNVASRLENATRRLRTPLVVSDESMRAIRRPYPESIGARLRDLGTIRLPGCGTQRIWAANGVARPEGHGDGA